MSIGRIFSCFRRARRRLNLYQVDPGGEAVEANLALFVADTGERRVGETTVPCLVHGQAESTVVAVAGPDIDVCDPLKGEGITAQRTWRKLPGRSSSKGLPFGSVIVRLLGSSPIVVGSTWTEAPA